MDTLKMGIDPSTLADDYNLLMYLINSAISGIDTIDVVKVQEVNTENNTLCVLPIVQRANANGNPIPESPIFNIKYMRWQYGLNAIKATPEVGDIGLVLVCKKDISSIQSGLVGSYREFSMADGVYIGGLMNFNQEPTQYIEFTAEGIAVTTPKTLTINTTENVVVNATKDVTVNAVNTNVNASASATITAPEINLGGSGGKKVALDGDNVYAGSTVIGTVKSSSGTTNSL